MSVSLMHSLYAFRPRLRRSLIGISRLSVFMFSSSMQRRLEKHFKVSLFLACSVDCCIPGSLPWEPSQESVLFTGGLPLLSFSKGVPIIKSKGALFSAVSVSCLPLSFVLDFFLEGFFFSVALLHSRENFTPAAQSEHGFFLPLRSCPGPLCRSFPRFRGLVVRIA